MNRRLLLQVTGPAVVIGMVLFGTCLVSAWYIDRLQTNFARVLYRNVTSLEAAQELEIRARQLRFNSFLHLIDPNPGRLARIAEAHRHFAEALERARESSNTPEEATRVQRIEANYQRYKGELDQLHTEAAQGGTTRNLGKLADAHPLDPVVEPCQELLRLNKQAVKGSSEESNRVTRQAHLAMLILGLVGPVSGLVIGYGVARGLSRSIYQLSVRVQNLAQRLDQDVTSVNIATDGDIHNLDQQLRYVVHRVEEVTERVQQHQRELLRAEQLSAVGQLGASVAHEIRNPLTGIKMLVDAALRTENSKPLTREDLRVIQGEIVRLEQTVQTFLDFARLPVPQRGTFDLREAVTHALELVRARARQQTVEIVVRAPADPVPVCADRGQLHTVIVNLLLNALDAMPGGGRLEVDVARSHKDQASLSVMDTGSGIAPEMKDRLFTPFASSKPTGTGLGLSISRRILEEHGGGITAFNRKEGGACFQITLPAVAGARAGSSGELICAS
jgi:signal transduction histidine kinase